MRAAVWEKARGRANLFLESGRGRAYLTFVRRIDCEQRIPPHPGPLPLGGGEGGSPTVSPRCWRCKSSNGQVLAIAGPTGPPDSLSPSEGERAGVRGEEVRLACAPQEMRCA